MAYSCDITTSSTVIRGALVGFFFASTLSSNAADFNDSVRLSSSTVLNETAVLNDAVTENRYQVIYETAVLNDRVVETALCSNTARETARIVSRAIDGVSNSVTDSAVLNDAVLITVSSILRDEAAAFRDRIDQTALLSTTVREQFRATDRVIEFVSDIVRESAVLNDAATSRTVAITTVIDTAVFSDSVVETAVLVNVASDSASFADRVEQNASTVNVVSDGAVVTGYVVEPLRGEAWTSSTDIFAMSRYTGFRFNSVAVIDGKLIAAGDGGLYELTGGLDGTQPITALLKTGLSDAGDQQQKRVREVFFGYEADATLSAKVSGTGTGDEQGFTYALPAKTANAAIANRLKVGRGMRSRYWRFEISNPSGEDFKINEIRANVEPLSRKV